MRPAAPNFLSEKPKKASQNFNSIFGSKVLRWDISGTALFNTFISLTDRKINKTHIFIAYRYDAMSGINVAVI